MLTTRAFCPRSPSRAFIPIVLFPLKSHKTIRKVTKLLVITCPYIFTRHTHRHHITPGWGILHYSCKAIICSCYLVTRVIDMLQWLARKGELRTSRLGGKLKPQFVLEIFSAFSFIHSPILEDILLIIIHSVEDITSPEKRFNLRDRKNLHKT